MLGKNNGVRPPSKLTLVPTFRSLIVNIIFAINYKKDDTKYNFCTFVVQCLSFNVGNQGHESRSFHRVGEEALVARAGAGVAAGFDFAPTR